MKSAVKSRLARAVGEDAALALYRCFVSDILAMLGKASSPVVICFYPSSARGKIEAWLGPSYAYMPQEGQDLGERMRNAFARAFSYGHEKAILIGSDIPDLPLAVIEEAFAALTVHDATIGPAADGGYYLIGSRSDTFLTDAFSGILVNMHNPELRWISIGDFPHPLNPRPQGRGKKSLWDFFGVEYTPKKSQAR